MSHTLKPFTKVKQPMFMKNAKLVAKSANRKSPKTDGKKKVTKRENSLSSLELAPTALRGSPLEDSVRVHI